MNTAAPTTSPKASAVSPLAAITSDLDELTPRFDVSADSIEIIKSPTAFYETLKVCYKHHLCVIQLLSTAKTDEDRKCQEQNILIDSLFRCKRV